MTFTAQQQHLDRAFFSRPWRRFSRHVLRQGQAAAAASAATSAAVRAHVPVPSQDAIREAILKRKKLALLKRLDGGEDAADDVED